MTNETGRLREGKELEEKLKTLEAKSAFKERNRGHFIRRYAVSNGICWIEIGHEELGHPTGYFEVREEDWRRVREAYLKAGYKVKYRIRVK